MHPTVLPVFLFALCVLGLAVALLVIANLFNPRRRGDVKEMPYESGMDPIHDTRRRFTIRFYLVAIAFLVFDVEILFLYPWAVAARPAVASLDHPTAATPAEVGATAAPEIAPPRGLDAAVAAGLVENRHLVFGGVMLFTALLILGFAYDWRKGVFVWR